MLDKIETGVVSLDAMVNDLLHFTSDRDPQLRNVQLRELVEDVLSSLAPQLSAQRIDTSVDVGTDCALVADRGMLRRAVLNLALNAIDAMPQGGVLVATGYAGTGGVELEIADSGNGLSDDVRGRAFEPFFHHQEPRNRLGFGHRLSDRRGSRRRSGGGQLPRGRRRVHAAITATSPDPSGASSMNGKSAVKFHEPAGSEPNAAAGRVLVVDDHAQARESMTDILRQAGHQVDCYSSALEGVANSAA